MFNNLRKSGLFESLSVGLVCECDAMIFCHTCSVGILANVRDCNVSA